MLLNVYSNHGLSVIMALLIDTLLIECMLFSLYLNSMRQLFQHQIPLYIIHQSPQGCSHKPL